MMRGGRVKEKGERRKEKGERRKIKRESLKVKIIYCAGFSSDHPKPHFFAIRGMAEGSRLTSSLLIA
ncbi:MAG: hypothetical protein ACOC2C_04545, partial [Cyclonatronaceae bacterium]